MRDLLNNHGQKTLRWELFYGMDRELTQPQDYTEILGLRAFVWILFNIEILQSS